MMCNGYGLAMRGAEHKMGDLGPRMWRGGVLLRGGCIHPPLSRVSTGGRSAKGVGASVLRGGCTPRVATQHVHTPLSTLAPTPLADLPPVDTLLSGGCMHPPLSTLAPLSTIC